MAWQTPKTDWGAPDGVRNTDLNRIEGNAQYLYDGAEALRQHVDDALFTISQRISIGSLPDGHEIGVYENGVLVPYLKIRNDYQNTGRALVVRKNSYAAARMQEGSFGYYQGSSVDTFLESTYLDMLDTATKAALTNVSIPVETFSGVSTIARRVFLLSRTEYNFSGAPVEGVVNYYFSNPDRRVALYTGMPYEHWTRTILDTTEEANYVTNTGSLGTGSPIAFVAGVRPAFTLPADFQVIAAVPSTANVYAIAEVIE